MDPDYIEYFYGNGGDVQPMIHYIPASWENITEMVAYVMDKKNEGQMKVMAMSANSWCKRTLNEERLGKEAILQLETYKIVLDTYSNSSWNHELRHVKQQFIDAMDNFVDCDAWSIVDHFLFLSYYF